MFTKQWGTSILSSIRHQIMVENMCIILKNANTSLNYKSDKVTCRVMKKGFGSELSSLPKEIESVILNNNDRDDITDDITRFIDSEENVEKEYTREII